MTDDLSHNHSPVYPRGWQPGGVIEVGDLRYVVLVCVCGEVRLVRLREVHWAEEGRT